MSLPSVPAPVVSTLPTSDDFLDTLLYDDSFSYLEDYKPHPTLSLRTVYYEMELILAIDLGFLEFLHWYCQNGTLQNINLSNLLYYAVVSNQLRTVQYLAPMCLVQICERAAKLAQMYGHKAIQDYFKRIQPDPLFNPPKTSFPSSLAFYIVKDNHQAFQYKLLYSKEKLTVDHVLLLIEMDRHRQLRWIFKSGIFQKQKLFDQQDLAKLLRYAHELNRTKLIKVFSEFALLFNRLPFDLLSCHEKSDLLDLIGTVPIESPTASSKKEKVKDKKEKRKREEEKNHLPKQSKKKVELVTDTLII